MNGEDKIQKGDNNFKKFNQSKEVGAKMAIGVKETDRTSTTCKENATAGRADSLSYAITTRHVSHQLGRQRQSFKIYPH